MTSMRRSVSPPPSIVVRLSSIVDLTPIRFHHAPVLCAEQDGDMMQYLMSSLKKKTFLSGV